MYFLRERVADARTQTVSTPLTTDSLGVLWSNRKFYQNFVHGDDETWNVFQESDGYFHVFNEGTALASWSLRFTSTMKERTEGPSFSR